MRQDFLTPNRWAKKFLINPHSSAPALSSVCILGALAAGAAVAAACAVAGAAAVAGADTAAALIAKLAANCCRIMSDTEVIMRPPNCANLPLTVTSDVPSSRHCPGCSPGRTDAARSIDAEEPPLSAPLF